MTINEVIRAADRLKHNTHNDEEKVAWLTRLDQMLVRTTINAHVREEDMELPHYDPDIDMDTELLADAPHDEMYIYWLMAQMDLANADFNQYNADITIFNSLHDAYSADYTRHHIPKAAGARFLF